MGISCDTRQAREFKMIIILTFSYELVGYALEKPKQLVGKSTSFLTVTLAPSDYDHYDSFPFSTCEGSTYTSGKVTWL